MPELPEVEAARRAIEEHCVGKVIRRSTVADDPKVIDAVTPSDFESALVGKKILSAHRKGKNLWICLDSPPFPSFQFGMAGAFYIKGVAVTKYKRSAVGSTEEWPSKYSKVFIEPESVSPISELGPDALFEPMEVDEFAGSLTKKKTAIKALLLDQSYISGIGNWIADEVLYQARIHPLQIAASLSKESCLSLHKCIKEVIQFAVAVDADSSCFPIEWLFHFRWGKKSGNVNGKKIEFITAGGRTTAYVPELQILTDSISGKSPPSRSRRSTKSNKGAVPTKSTTEGSDEEEYQVKPKSNKGAVPTKKRLNKATHDDQDDEDQKPAAKKQLKVKPTFKKKKTPV